MHKLIEIVMLVLVSCIADNEDFKEVKNFGKDKKEYLQAFLELASGIPSHNMGAGYFVT